MEQALAFVMLIVFNANEIIRRNLLAKEFAFADIIIGQVP